MKCRWVVKIDYKINLLLCVDTPQGCSVVINIKIIMRFLNGVDYDDGDGRFENMFSKYPKKKIKFHQQITRLTSSFNHVDINDDNNFDDVDGGGGDKFIFVFFSSEYKI